jgi:hypothetical protein
MTDSQERDLARFSKLTIMLMYTLVHLHLDICNIEVVLSTLTCTAYVAEAQQALLIIQFPIAIG